MQYIIYSIGTTSPGPRIKQLVTGTSGSNDICSALQNQASALLGRRYCVRPASPAGDLAGQVVIVTGASSGLGAEVVRQVVKRGATVVLACRNSQAAALVLEQMRKEGGAGQALFIHLDLASLESVKSFVDDVNSRFSSINALVCNAGVWVPMEQRCQTRDGFEVHAGVNHLAHFLLVNLLLPSFTPTARIVIVSSTLLKLGQINFDVHEHFGNGRESDQAPGHVPTGYSDSKLMNALFVRELAARQRLKVVCVSPGWCRTNLSRNLNISWARKLLLAPIALIFTQSAAQGGKDIVWALVSEAVESGKFYRKEKMSVKEESILEGWESLGIQARLWKESEKAVRG